MSEDPVIVIDGDSDDSDDVVICTDPSPSFTGFITFIRPEQLAEKMKDTEPIYVSTNSPEQDDCVILDELPKQPQVELLKPLFAIDKPLGLENKGKRRSTSPHDYPCSHCSKIFYDKEQLQLHELELYKKKAMRKINLEKTYECDVCHNCFGNEPSLQWHTLDCPGKVIAKSKVNKRKPQKRKRKRKS